MVEDVLNYLKKNEKRNMERLKEFLSIPSISTDYNYKYDIRRAAQFVQDYLDEINFKTELIETNRHPVVFAEYNEAGESAPTVLFYGHYDVQPVDPLDEWDSEPFEPTERNGRLYARGASDDKGQVFMHLAVFEAFMKKKNKLPVNVKVCIEGEEEIGSPHLYETLENNKDKFQADFVVISDSGMIAPDQPTILYGLKGMAGLEINVKGPDYDLHSGLYGGAVKNPVMALTHILATMKNQEEVIMVDGFYDDVEPISREERQLIARVEGEDYKQTTGVNKVVSEKGYTAKEHTMARPTLEINGIYGGYQGEGTKTIIPSEATAKISCRLVPNQNPEIVQQRLIDHIHEVTPEGVHVNITRDEFTARPYKVEPTNEYIQKAAKSYEKAFGKKTIFARMGGSIPVVEWLNDIYNIPIVLLGFGTPDDRLHSPNESFPLRNLHKGMETLVYYWHDLGK